MEATSAQSQRRMTGRAWVFTLFGVDESTATDAVEWNPEKMSLLTYQLERCPTTQQLHLQGTVRMKKTTTFRAMKTLLGQQVHLEQCANLQKSLEYCTKSETRVAGPWTHGEPTQQGRRNDLVQVAQEIKAGKRPRDIADSSPTTFLKYYKGLQALHHAYHPPQMQLHRVCILLIGHTGCGKTRLAYDIFDHKDIWMMPDATQMWFDGYDQQKVAIIDECGEGMINYNTIKRLTDIYPLTVPCKGGFLSWNPKIIIFTAQQPMHTWWPKATQSDMNALERRIKVFSLPHQRDEAITTLLHPQRTFGSPDRDIPPTQVDIVDVDQEDAISVSSN